MRQLHPSELHAIMGALYQDEVNTHYINLLMLARHATWIMGMFSKDPIKPEDLVGPAPPKISLKGDAPKSFDDCIASAKAKGIIIPGR